VSEQELDLGIKRSLRPSGPSWKNSPTSTPAAISWSRATTMSEAIKNALAEPGAADLTFLPKWAERQEPGGVNWTRRKSSPAERSTFAKGIERHVLGNM
jgi:hypothetical protein